MSFDHRKYAPFPVVDKPDRRWPSRRIEKAPLWAAVDLRDGNQALIKPMNVAQKKRFFQLLVELFGTLQLGHELVGSVYDQGQRPTDFRSFRV